MFFKLTERMYIYRLLFKLLFEICWWWSGDGTPALENGEALSDSMSEA